MRQQAEPVIPIRNRAKTGAIAAYHGFNPSLPAPVPRGAARPLPQAKFAVLAHLHNMALRANRVQHPSTFAGEAPASVAEWLVFVICTCRNPCTQ